MDEYKEKTKESYNKHTALHTQRFLGLMDTLRRTEYQMFMDLLPGKKILDAGCGGGDNALYFKNHGFDVLGIDIAEKMVEMARTKGIPAEVMDMEDMQFAPQTFDGIWAVTSLLHVPKKKLSDVIKTLHTILKEGGIAYVCVKEGVGEEFKLDANDTTKRFFSYWQKEELQSLFESLFTVVDFKRDVVGSRTFLMFFFRKK